MRELILQDEEGVSTVVGTILLIAITVVAAGTIGYFVLSQGSPESAPTAALSVEREGSTAQIYHNGGDNLDNADLNIKNGDSTISYSENFFAVGDNINLGKYSESRDNRILVVHTPTDTILLDTVV